LFKGEWMRSIWEVSKSLTFVGSRRRSVVVKTPSPSDFVALTVLSCCKGGKIPKPEVLE
jgi:hypothetical protein